MKFCKLADRQDWQNSDFQATADRLGCGEKSRKAWEFIQVYQGLKQLNLLTGDAKCIGLGVGHECLIYAFTNVCQQVVATDLYESQEWATAAMAVQDVYDKSPFAYQPDRLTVRHMDMTQIAYPDTSFDFVWSCCAIEHVNNFRDLYKVYQEIHRVLKPGGIAALTTEFNHSDRPSYEPNLLFTDQAWMQAWLIGDHATGHHPIIQGFELIDRLDWTISDLPENEPVSRRQPQGSIQVYCNDIVLNSVAFFLRKTGEFSSSYSEAWLPPFWQQYLAACDAYRSLEFSAAEAILKQLLQSNTWEPRLQVRALRRLADALFAQAKLDEVKQTCLAALPHCETFQDEDQLMPLAAYCWQVGLSEAAKQLYEQVLTLPSANTELVIQSWLGQARYYEAQKQFDLAIQAINKAAQEIRSGDYTEAKYQPEIQFHNGFCHEKLNKLSMAIRFYKQAIDQAEANSELQMRCYRRLTACLQTQVKRSREKVEQLEAKTEWMQTSKFWKLRSIVVGIKSKWQRDSSPFV